MKVLVVNAGSSSIKYQLLTPPENKPLAKGTLEKIGIPGSLLTHSVNGEKHKIEQDILDHSSGIALVLKTLTDPEIGVIEDVSEIEAVGHRMVHGGEKFYQPTLVTAEVMEVLKDCIPLAPLHNPHNVQGIEACRKVLPAIPQVVVFDTAFHADMPEYAYLYALPYELYIKHRFRRYGFHGTSHYYVANEVAKRMGRENDPELKIVTAHLGNGGSVAAVKGGKSVDTSMGYTPVEGLVMGTRCGDIDPFLFVQIMDMYDLETEQASNLMNKFSGLKGVSGLSSDMRILEDAMETNERAKLAVEMFSYRVLKYIGAYSAAMGGLDAIVFTGGIGTNSPIIRKWVCDKLGYLGVKIDQPTNEDGMGNKTLKISTGDSKVDVWAYLTNEELVIALQTSQVVKNLRKIDER
ncbi:MAG: acetate kinase [Planctomycetota bacterium]|nr:acetate kinase [Planctomycetota bacterium]